MVLGKAICTALCHWPAATGRGGWFGRVDDRLTIHNHNSLPCLSPNKYGIPHQKNASKISLEWQQKSNIPHCSLSRILESPSHSASAETVTRAPWLGQQLHRVACVVTLQHPSRGRVVRRSTDMARGWVAQKSSKSRAKFSLGARHPASQLLSILDDSFIRCWQWKLCTWHECQMMAVGCKRA